MYSHNANIQGVKFSWQKAVGSWQFANCILPTFILNYYQIMKRTQRNVKSDSFNYLIIYY
jgi:hypothetical protein